MTQDVTDTTGIKRTEDYLKKSEKLLRAIFDSSPEYICVTTIFGEYVEVNKAFCEAFGLVREQVIGKTGAGIHRWVSLETRTEFLELLGKHKSVDCFKADMRHSSGDIIECLLSARVMKVDGVPLVVITTQDITNECYEL